LVKLKELREARNVRPEKLAAEAGVSVRTLTNYEQGNTVPPVDVARRIAEFLGVPEADIDWGAKPADDPKGAPADAA
jgi:transcriptional regulator with XRE-family HTH domain